MEVNTVDQITVTATEMQQAILTRIEQQTGMKVGKVALRILWNQSAPGFVPEIEVYGTSLIRGVIVEGVFLRPQTPPTPTPQEMEEP